MALVRFNRMHPDTDTNLHNFLTSYVKAGVYLLMPAIIEDEKPQLLYDVAILKRNFIVKSAKNVSSNDIEQCCLGLEADEYFANSDAVPPIICP